MKRKAVLATLEGLSDAAKADYVPAKVMIDGKEVDGFALDIEGVELHPSTGALKRAKDHEKERRSAVEEELRKTRAALEEASDKERDALKGMLPKGNVEALEKSYQEKIKGKETEIAALRDGLHRHLVRNVAQEVASAIAVDKDAVPGLIPHILPRLSAETVGGDAVTRVLGLDGKPTALTVEDLQKELLASKALSRLVLGTQGSGGGAGNAGKGPSSGSAATPIDYSKSPAEIVAAMKLADPQITEE